MNFSGSDKLIKLFTFYCIILYISRDVKSVYRSYNTILALSILNSNFTRLVLDFIGMICDATNKDCGKCSCPKWRPVPGQPEKLLLPCNISFNINIFLVIFHAMFLPMNISLLKCDGSGMFFSKWGIV